MKVFFPLSSINFVDLEIDEVEAEVEESESQNEK